MKQEEKMTDPYRLGDMVRFFGTEEYGMNKEYVKQFPGTIGNKYWKHAENKTNDYSANMNTLVSIVNEHCANTVKHENGPNRKGLQLCVSELHNCRPDANTGGTSSG